jgi:hypothetical protein
MGKSSKPKKKYTPRQVRAPSLITSMNSFEPFEKALNKLLDTGECETDQFGTLIYKDPSGVTQAFAFTVKTYIEIIDIYCKKHNLIYDLKPLHLLQNSLYEAIGFDEEEIDKAKVVLQTCKDIINKIKPTELMKILESIRIQIGLEKVSPESLKDPEVLLFKLKHKLGDLTYEEVLEKNKYFQERVISGNTSDRIIKLRDVYVEYLAAYNFTRRKQLGI